jgi:hypothetical protein
LLRKDNEASLFAIFFIGTIALFLLVEMQNRYHYFALQSLAILAAGGIGFTYEFYRQRSELRISNKLMLLADVELAAGVVEEEVKEGAVLETSEVISVSTTAASKMNTIDVIKAIQEGHIRITATKAYQEDGATVTDEVSKVQEANEVDKALEQLAVAIELEALEDVSTTVGVEEFEAIAPVQVESKETDDLNKVVKQNKEVTTNKNTVSNHTVTNKVVNKGTIQDRTANANKSNNANRISTTERRATSNQSTQKRTSIPKKNVSTGTKRHSDDIIKNVIDGLLNQRSKSSKNSGNMSRNKAKHQGKAK